MESCRGRRIKVQMYTERRQAEGMKFTKGPVAFVVLALAAEMAYIVIKGSKEVAKAKPHKDNRDRSCQK